MNRKETEVADITNQADRRRATRDFLDEIRGVEARHQFFLTAAGATGQVATARTEWGQLVAAVQAQLTADGG